MLRNVILVLILPLIFFSPLWSCCCLSDMVSIQNSNVEVESCCENESIPNPKESHNCKCDKFSKSLEIKKVGSLDLSKKITLEVEALLQKEPSYFEGLKTLQYCKESPSFIVSARKNPPRSYYLQYCSYLI